MLSRIITMDKSSLYGWTLLLNVVVEGTGVAAAQPKPDGTFDANLTKFVPMLQKYTSVTLEHC